MSITLNAGFTAENGDTADATYLNSFVNTGTITLATDKLVGRSSSGAGVAEEIPCTSAGRALLSASTASAQLTALGIGSSGTLSGLTLVSANRYETTVSTLSYSSTVTLDFSTNNIQTLPLTGNVTINTSNLASGRAKQVLITADTTTRTITFPSWVWLGGSAPSQIAASKAAMLSLMSFGTTDGVVMATWTAQV